MRDIATLTDYTDRDDVFGFGRDVIVAYLSWEQLRPLRDPADSRVNDERVLWNACAQPYTPEQVLSDARDYMAFAWSKVIDHRGISAERSVAKMRAYAWLLFDDDVVARIDVAPYPQYGAPKLKVVSDALNFPIPCAEAEDEDVDLQRMIDGLPCEADCPLGCC